MAVLREPAYRGALRHGVAAAVEHDSVPFGREFRTVVDVGAGRGQFALVARRRFPQAGLVCVEPLASSRSRLERAVGLRGGVDVHPVAASATDGEAEFVVSAAADSSSLLPATRLQTETFPGTGEAARITVRTARLDSLLDVPQLAGPVLLKIDVQGSELDVLRGAPGLLEAVDEVLVECSFAELYRGQALAGDVEGHLHARGFSLVAVCSPVTDRGGVVLQADLLFARRHERATTP